LKESFETGEPRPLKYVFILPDGTQKNIETISEPVRDEAGNVVKLMGTVMDVTERQNAEDALRASERLARGQIETLTRTLDVTARESSPDKIVEQVLRNFTAQLDAHSSSVWLRDEASDLMVFEFALEEGCFRTKANAQLARISPALRIEDVWVWPVIFRTGKPSLVEDIRAGPDFPWRANLLAQGVVSVLTVPMLVSGVVTGVIGIRFTKRRAFRAEELELAQALTNQVMLAMKLIRLSEQNREAAVIAERNRMARDVHDALAQGFTGVIVQLEAAEDAASKGLVSEAQTHLARAGHVARHGLTEARRSVRALRLQGLEDGDLCSALDALFRRMATDTSLHPEFVLRGVPQPLLPEWEENLLRIAQEALTNVLRHAHATQFKVRLHFETRQLLLELRDDGCGFDPELRRDGFGLVGMRERVEQMAGHFLIQTTVGAGTTITITLPLMDNSKPSDS
jgi:signal transduction histidine kinase